MTTTDDGPAAHPPAERPQPPVSPASAVSVRPFVDDDRPFLQRIVHRLVPGETAAPRDPARFADWFRRLAAGELEQSPTAEAFLAVDPPGHPLGVLILHTDREYFTGYERAYVEVLVVAPEAEGRGVGQALMRHAEAWARDRGYPEVSLDVFAGNARATAFYERFGFRPDHIRMVKRL